MLKQAMRMHWITVLYCYRNGVNQTFGHSSKQKLYEDSGPPDMESDGIIEANWEEVRMFTVHIEYLFQHIYYVNLKRGQKKSK